MILLQPTLIVRIYKQFISFRNSFKIPLQRTVGGVSFEHFEQQIAKLFEFAKTCCYQEFWPSPRFVTFHKSQNKGLVHQLLQESSCLFVRTVHMIVLSLQIVQQNVQKPACQEIFLLANPRLPQPDYLLSLNLVVTTSWGSYQPL